MTELVTARLSLRRPGDADAGFVHELVNQPSWLRHIGDKQVRSLDDARRYIAEGPLATFARFGFGLYCVERRSDGLPLGLCGLVKRDYLPEPDIGFAFLDRHCGQGYAAESAVAVLGHAAHPCGLARVGAIVAPANLRSMHLLEKLGFAFERWVDVPDGTAPLRFYGRALGG